MRGLRTATCAAVVLAALGGAIGSAGAAVQAPLPRLAKIGKPPSTLKAGGAFTMRFRATNPSRRMSARSHATVRLTGSGRRVGLGGKAVIPALKGRGMHRGSRRYKLPAGIAPGRYRLVVCVKRAGVRALCKTAPGTLVVPAPDQGGDTQPPGAAGTQPPGGGGTQQPPPGGGTQQPPSTDPPPQTEPDPPPDTTAPAVAISAPAQGSDTDSRRPTVSGTADTGAGDERSVTVRLTGAGAPQTLSAPVSDAGTWSVTPGSDLAPGTWSASAEQSDVAGNTGTSAARAFAVSAVLLAAGDIASCAPGFDGATQTAALLDQIGGDVVAPLGDLAYENGAKADFDNCYDPTWGRAKARSRPAIGNHEYEDPLSPPPSYFTYFNGLGSSGPAGDPAKGYYSYDLGAWHIIVLNSNCSQVSCSGSGAQVAWLAADLSAHSNRCTLAYYHHPLFTSSALTGAQTATASLWNVLDAGGADVILNGHAHVYERFARQRSDGTPANDAPREIVAGTGGYDHHDLNLNTPNSEARDNTTFGVLKMTLRSSSYRWDFVPVSGGTFTDSGVTDCS